MTQANESSKKDKEIQILKVENQNLKKDLLSKDEEIQKLKAEFFKISMQLDQLMSNSSLEVDMLKKIQKYMTPTELPNISGFEFSRKFVFGTQSGGDYFDIFETDDKLKFGLLVSASSGYGMSALFLSMILKLSYLIEARKGSPPENILQQINSELISNTDQKLLKSTDQVHLFYGIVDRRNLRLSFCAAGKIKALLQTPGQPIKVLSSEHNGLGSDAELKLNSIDIDFEPRSRLTLVTLGVLDVLSLEKIAEIIENLGPQAQAHDVRNEVLFQCEFQSGLKHPLRDQTVVVVEVKDKVIKLAK